MKAPRRSTKAAQPDGSRRAVVFVGIAIVLATLAVYANSFSGPFIFDDIPSISGNPSIRSVLDSLFPPVDGSTVANRPLLNFSFALNYAISGESVWSYHALNLVIHALAALTLFGIVRRTLLFWPRHTFPDRDGMLVAAAAALLWALHPLQTESVTYIVQRAESLMGLFYLLTLYCFVRGVQPGNAPGNNADQAGLKKTGKRVLSSAEPALVEPSACVRRRLWFGLSLTACLAGVLTKEVAATAPLVVLFYDRAFVSGSWGETWRKRRGFHLALMSAWLLLGVFLFRQGWNRGGTAGFGVEINVVEYWMTQVKAVVLYLRLSLWPDPLVFDYGMGLTKRVTDILPEAILLLFLVSASAVTCLRRPQWGFPAAWFFVILSVTCAIPVATQVVAEHRMYLPLAAVTTYASIGLFAAAGRKSLFVFPFLVLILGAMTLRRNGDYQSDAAIWGDTVAHCPENDRAHSNFGSALSLQPGRLGEAVAEYREALRLNPDYAEAHYNLGNVLSQMPGRLGEAVAAYREALRLNPNSALMHGNLGSALLRQPGRFDEAVAEFREALRLNPNDALAHNNLGNALSRQPGRFDEAVAEYREALHLNPDYALAHNNLGNVLSQRPERLGEAVAEYREALRLNPDSPETHYNLGNALSRLPGRLDEAVAEFREAVRLNPSFAEAHNSLGCALSRQPGHQREGIAHIRESLRLNPNFPPAWRNLGVASLNAGDLQTAAAAFREEVRLLPDDPRAREALSGVLRMIEEEKRR